MQALDATILNTALPAIAHSLNRSPLAMQSAIISYTLTVAMLIPVSGWLADRFGTRRSLSWPLACLRSVPWPARSPVP
jgi:MFS family permease